KVTQDFMIVKKFNDIIKTEFGAQPGTVFDVNLYATAPLKKAGAPQTPVEKNMQAMTEAGQDVGALMKMRRYMSWDDYVEYQEKVLADMKGNPELVEATKRQFEEADDLYFMSLVALLEKAKQPIPKQSGIEGQKAIIEAVEHLEENSEALMEANNAIYIERMADV